MLTLKKRTVVEPRIFFLPLLFLVGYIGAFAVLSKIPTEFTFPPIITAGGEGAAGAGSQSAADQSGTQSGGAPRAVPVPVPFAMPDGSSPGVPIMALPSATGAPMSAASGSSATVVPGKGSGAGTAANPIGASTPASDCGNGSTDGSGGTAPSGTSAPISTPLPVDTTPVTDPVTSNPTTPVTQPTPAPIESVSSPIVTPITQPIIDSSALSTPVVGGL